MKLVCAIIRPEKTEKVVKALEAAGYNAYTKWSVSGRGKQRGIQVGDVFYEEMPKKMIYIVVEDKEKDEVIDIIINNAKYGEKGNRGDGKIFVQTISEVYTISEDCDMQ